MKNRIIMTRTIPCDNGTAKMRQYQDGKRTVEFDQETLRGLGLGVYIMQTSIEIKKLIKGA